MDPAHLQDVQQHCYALGAAGDVRKRDTHPHPAGIFAKPYNTTHWDSLLMSFLLAVTVTWASW